MRRLLLAAILLAACAKSEAPAANDTADDVRTPIATEYVRGVDLKVHGKPDDASPVVATYGTSESVSILSKKGDWDEVRTVDGSGWVHASELATAAEIAKANADGAEGAGNTSARFIVPPEPVTQPGAHGDITLEADVNSSGEVFNVRVTENNTGSEALAQRNVESLKKARFAPIVKHGERMPFTYEHRVHY
jgi:TonB family protein